MRFFIMSIPDYVVIELDYMPDPDVKIEGYPDHSIRLITGLGPYLVVLRRVE